MRTNWELTFFCGDLFIDGPGDVEIRVENFDPDKIIIPPQLGAEFLGSLKYKTWRYAITETFVLQLTTIWDESRPGSKRLNDLILRTGPSGPMAVASWQLSDEDAEKFHRLVHCSVQSGGQ